MTKRKKKKEKQNSLMTVVITISLLFAMFIGFIVAKFVTENKIKNQAGPIIYNLKDSLELVCAHVDKMDPYIKVDYVYYVDCYYTTEKSDYRMSRIIINNNGVVTGIVYRLSVDTSKSKETTYEEINNIMRDTVDAIEASNIKEKSIVLNKAKTLPKEFILKFNNSSYEKDTILNERINNNGINTSYTPQSDETPYIPPYIEIGIY